MKIRKTLEERYRENRDLEKSIFQTQRSYYKFIGRIKKRVEEMVENEEYTYFITYTLNETSLKNTTEKQHIKKIKRTLTGNSHYLINNDYGDIADRLHYHTLASFPYPYDTTFLTKWDLGFTNIKRIRDKSPQKITKYILKLSNHATKKSVAKIWRSRKEVKYYG